MKRQRRRLSPQRLLARAPQNALSSNAELSRALQRVSDRTTLVGQTWSLSFFVTNMIFMIGLAVGIDYCLFIIERFREERRRGLEKLEAIAAAGNTASRAVLFSGLTVVIALLGMFLVPSNIFRSLGISSFDSASRANDCVQRLAEYGSMR